MVREWDVSGNPLGVLEDELRIALQLGRVCALIITALPSFCDALITPT